MDSFVVCLNLSHLVTLCLALSDFFLSHYCCLRYLQSTLSELFYYFWKGWWTKLQNYSKKNRIILSHTVKVCERKSTSGHDASWWGHQRPDKEASGGADCSRGATGLLWASVSLHTLAAAQCHCSLTQKSCSGQMLWQLSTIRPLSPASPGTGQCSLLRWRSEKSRYHGRGAHLFRRHRREDMCDVSGPENTKYMKSWLWKMSWKNKWY